MPYYDNWDDLTASAQKKCSDVLKKDVAPVAKEIVKRHIQTDIYDKYTPVENGWVNGTTYQRRGTLLQTVRHYYNDAKDEIIITSPVTASKSILRPGFKSLYPGAFLEMLEKGDMGFWRKDFPRPAISNAQKEIEHSAEIRHAIENGLNRVFNS